MRSLSSFLAYLEAQVSNHSIYVWGAQGQRAPMITPAWIRKKETGEKTASRAIAFWQKQVDAGYGQLLRAFDCSGLGMYYLRNVAGIYKYDMSSNGMLATCKRIPRDALRRGDWVFRTYQSGADKGRAYHIGYVVDDAHNVIEAKGRDDGVIKRPFSNLYWDISGRPAAFAAEIAAPQPAAPAGAHTSDLLEETPCYAYCTGARVHVRAAASSQAPILKTASKGEVLLALGEKDGWREIAFYNRRALSVGYMAAKYVGEA